MKSQIFNSQSQIANRKLQIFSASLRLCGCLCLLSPAQAEDIPRWRGPKSDGFTTETLPDKWPPEGPKKLWSQKVGAGYSSPIAVNGRIYMFAQPDNRDTLFCFDESGHQLW